MFTFASPFRLFGSAPGRGVPTRRSGVAGLPSAAGAADVMSRQLSMYGMYSAFLPGWYAVGHQLRVLNEQIVCRSPGFPRMSSSLIFAVPVLASISEMMKLGVSKGKGSAHRNWPFV